MSESNEINRYMDTEKKKSSEITLEENKDEVLIFIMEKGVSYPTELSRQTNISIEGINQIIRYFKKMNFLEKITPHPDTPQPVFRGRMNEMWAMGIYGYAKINSFSWWTITQGGIEYLRIKYKGKKLQIKGALLKTYKLNHPDLESSSP